MPSAYDLVANLTSGTLSELEYHRILRDFSHELGWRPSYQLTERRFLNGIANAHLIVEHGLETSAVITFLNRSIRFSDLESRGINDLLAISYNNLVDWHLCVEPDKVIFCFNRTDPPIIDPQPISRSSYTSLRSQAFEQVIGRQPNPNLPNLDQALIRTISDWKRNISAEMGYSVPNENLSALFNAVLFIRAVEDHHQHRYDAKHAVLLDEWHNKKTSETIKDIVKASLRRFVDSQIPEGLLDERKLDTFSTLERDTVLALLNDFYRNRWAPYQYDFSLISKHALSRIYEHYTSLLRVEDSPQASLFPSLPEEERNRAYGSVYTPQFIARFFARFLREQKPPGAFRRIKTVDPACGSGIFLRTLLELQCDLIQDGVTSETINLAFKNILGLDIDENASQATNLSLTLLYLVLTGTLPSNLPIVTIDAIEYYENHPELKHSFDAVIVNPPFVSLGMQTEEMRQRLANFMGKDSKGRIDTYLAFLRLGLELLRPGGFGLFVLPHSFVISETARAMRSRLAQESWIHCLADLSAIRIFGNLGSYILLLIFEKKLGRGEKPPTATILKCQDFVGHALEDYLEGRRPETSFYSIYEVSQHEFQRNDWIVLPPTETSIRRRVNELPRLTAFANIREGLVTGADETFIINNSAVPAGEEVIFAPFLPDRDMERYHVPSETGERVFYPFLDGRKFSSEELAEQFPQTWHYLSSHRRALESRKAVVRGDLNWWEPERPRRPEHLLRPKIVSPHLVLVPRFSLDYEGKYAVSRSPFLYPKESSLENDLLRFLLAVLNSSPCYWYISTHSHKYSRGYTMLEPKTLKMVPIPDPAQISSGNMRRLLNLVERRLTEPSALEVEIQIDEMIAELYGLSSKERQAIGMV